MLAELTRSYDVGKSMASRLSAYILRPREPSNGHTNQVFCSVRDPKPQG
jgi:hypothetical protein